jgi:hypothetical protein
MTSARDWLDRFRRLAAPPAVPAVPTIPSDEPSRELVPVFAVLDEIEHEARTLLDDAEREKADRVQAAQVEVDAALFRRRRDAEAERVRVEAEQREATARNVQAIERDAAAEADRLRARGAERVSTLVEEIVACIREGAG